MIQDATQASSFDWKPWITILAVFVSTFLAFVFSLKLENQKAKRLQKEQHLNKLAELYSDLYEFIGAWLLSIVREHELITLQITLESIRKEVADTGELSGKPVSMLPTDLDASIKRMSESIEKLQDRLHDSAANPLGKVHRIEFLDADNKRLGHLHEVVKMCEIIRTDRFATDTKTQDAEVTLNKEFYKIRASIHDERAELNLK